MGRKGITVLNLAILTWVSVASGQIDSAKSNLTERGHLNVGGREAPYVIRRLPVSSFPELPREIAAQLDERGCMIPQTYQAHRPENVIHASLERAGSSDWAVLCSSGGTVQLMVFFGSSPKEPSVLEKEPETARMETHDRSGVLGFAWGIDPASPRRVREAQFEMEHHPPLLDHDALADVFVEKGTLYHFFTKNAWKVIDTTD
jgi:hypothetical protein